VRFNGAPVRSLRGLATSLARALAPPPPAAPAAAAAAAEEERGAGGRGGERFLVFEVSGSNDATYTDRLAQRPA
jgi:hypothetical protein